MEELKELYNNRFDEKKKKQKNGIWIEICRFFHKYLQVKDGKILDVAAGYCDFINNIDFQGKKYAIDLNPDVVRYADENVTSIVDSIDCIDKHFLEGDIDIIFTSNFLEHISKDVIEKFFDDSYKILKANGQLWILTPNIKYVGGKYWDFWDHITPITDRSLIELAETKGYRLKKNIRRFLPYSTKSHLPQGRFIVRLYLMLLPISGAFFGEQSFLIFEKKG